jgi:dTDP-4-dehydrorhamnose reductase
MKILLTGGNGLVGGRLHQTLKKTYNIQTPSAKELDITKAKLIQRWFHRHTPDIVIHSACFTSADLAERQRGDKKASAWQINVAGTKHIVHAAKKYGARVIYISTASVFNGLTDTKKIFKESDTPSKNSILSWYAITKKEAERLIPEGGSIIRLSHPITSVIRTGHPDYLHDLLTLYHRGRLFSLFGDQRFAISLIEDVALGIRRIIDLKKTGTFHIASTTLASPYKIVSYALGRTTHKPIILQTIPFAKFLRTVDFPLRYAQTYSLNSKKTNMILSLPKRSWQEVVDQALLDFDHVF